VLLVAAGIIGLLGAVAGLVIPLLLAATGLWVWRNRGVVETCFPAADTTPTPPVAGVATTTTPQFMPMTPIDPCLMSVPQLCLAWHRSYWLLHDLPPGPARSDMVSRRQRLLDELERRDPAGFDRWLHSGASANSNPGCYLTGIGTDPGGDQNIPTP
jgi:hypothetical protein